jgi:hypothetical protein
MHVQIATLSGQRINLAMSWRDVLNGPGRLGEIYIEVEKGIGRHIPKSAITDVFEFTDERWDALVKEEKERAERQQYEQVLSQRVQAYNQKKGEFDAWAKRPFLKRVLRTNPVVVPPNPVRPAPKVTLLDAKPGMQANAGKEATLDAKAESKA